MSLVPYHAPTAGRAPAWPRQTLRLQPDSRAGTIYDRAERRRPNDRRQHDGMVYLDTRTNKSERRRDHRRTVYDPGRRQWPESPLGIDIWV